MVNEVLSLKFFRTIDWISRSVSRSTDAVASSMTNILVFRNKARLIQMSWRWPTLKFDPFSSTIASSPPSSDSIKCFKLTMFNASHNSVSECSPKGSKLYRTVPKNSTGSCGIIDSLDRRSSKPIVEISIPSISIDPSANSTILNSACKRL